MALGNVDQAQEELFGEKKPEQKSCAPVPLKELYMLERYCYLVKIPAFLCLYLVFHLKNISSICICVNQGHLYQYQKFRNEPRKFHIF